MTKRSSPNGQANNRLDPFLDYAIELLRKKPVIQVAELETEIAKHFRDVLNTDDMPGRKRKRWENLVDWVKATLTRRGVIQYHSIANARCILFLETADLPALVTLREAWSLIHAVLDAHKGEQA